MKTWTRKDQGGGGCRSQGANELDNSIFVISQCLKFSLPARLKKGFPYHVYVKLSSAIRNYFVYYY